MLHIFRSFARVMTLAGIVFLGTAVADAKSDYATALKRIEVAANSGAKTLDLSELSELDFIPDEISSLTELTHLDLSYTRISNLEILQSLRQLKHLELRAARLSDKNIRPLASLTGLKSLDLRQNFLTEINALAGLKELSALDISSNDIASLEPLEELALIEELDISFNQDIAFISILLKQDKLKKLSVTHMWVDDIDIIGQFMEMEELDIGYSGVGDLSFVLQLPKLKILWHEMERVTADKLIFDQLLARGVRVIPY